MHKAVQDKSFMPLNLTENFVPLAQNIQPGDI
jgi:hypothetical protein